MKRQVIACLLAIGLVWEAHAADPRVYEPTDLVPAPPLYWDWGGIYFGGQWGAASGTIDPGNATNSLVAHILRVTTIEAEGRVSEWSQLQRSSTSGQNYGGFVGFNSQWEDVILSLELQYNYGKISGAAADSIGRSFTASDGYLYNVTVSSSASVAIKDYGSLRGRAGYAMGRFLPYAQLGFVVGRADLVRSATVTASGTDADPGTPPVLPPIGLGPTTMTERKDNAFIYGFSAGVGLDVAITQSIFLRGEYEYVQFFPFSGFKANINTGRVGVGVKF